MPKASLRIVKSGGRDAALRRPVGAARRPYHYAGNTVDSVTSLSIASVLPTSVSKVRSSSTFGLCIDSRSPCSAKVFDPRCRAECVGTRNKSMRLNGLDQFGLRHDLDIRSLGFEHPV